MLKTIITISFLIFSFSLSAQKKDTTIQVTFTLNEYYAILNAINQNIDSKKTSDEILSYIDKRKKIIESDKPKSIK